MLPTSQFLLLCLFYCHSFLSDLRSEARIEAMLTAKHCRVLHEREWSIPLNEAVKPSTNPLERVFRKLCPKTTLDHIVKVEISEDAGDAEVSSLRLLEYLTHVEIGDGRMTMRGFRDLGGCKELRQIWLGKGFFRLKTLEPLRDCQKLENLSLHYAQLAPGDLKSIENKRSLKFVTLFKSQFVADNLKSLASLPSLEEVELLYCSFDHESLSVLSAARKLRYLKIDATCLDELESLAAFKGLEGLSLNSLRYRHPRWNLSPVFQICGTWVSPESGRQASRQSPTLPNWRNSLSSTSPSMSLY